MSGYSSGAMVWIVILCSSIVVNLVISTYRNQEQDRYIESIDRRVEALEYERQN